jgi:predicted nucleotidyltransferase
MNEILNDLSGKIDLSLIRVLSEVKAITEELKIDFFIIGATARDIVMQYLHGIRAPRMTRDIDIAVCLSDWDEYSNLTETLLSKGVFRKSNQKQRFVYEDTVIDIIPFGKISGPASEIRWPPDYDIIMRTIGFMDVYSSSITFRLSSKPPLDIKLASIPGLAVLKLLAWKEKPSRDKDAEDLLFIMHNYQNTGIQDRLYEDEPILLEEEKFDIERAGIRLLGRDMAKISNSDTAKALLDILISETGEDSSYKLVSQMSGNSDRFDTNMLLLEKLKQGFVEGPGQQESQHE